MSNLEDSTNNKNVLKVCGDVTVGVRLVDSEREESLVRGGDGKIARFNGGWLQAGGINDILDFQGKEVTFHLRVCFDPRTIVAALGTKLSESSLRTRSRRRLERLGSQPIGADRGEG